MSLKIKIAALAAVIACTGPGAKAAEIKVLCAGAFLQVVEAALPDFEKTTGHKVTVERGTAGQLKDRVERGDAFDVAVITPGVIDALIKEGKLAADSHVKVATVGVGVGVKEGAPKPDISTVAAFKQTLLDAKSVAYIDPASGGSSGIYVDKLLERLGIAGEVRPKAKLKRGGHAADFVASGEADIVLQQMSEILPVKGVSVVGPLPAEIQNITTYSAAISTQSKNRAAAQALIGVFADPKGVALLKAKGMQPAS